MSEVFDQEPEQLGLLGINLGAAAPDEEVREAPAKEYPAAARPAAEAAGSGRRAVVVRREQPSAGRQLAPMLQQYVDVKRAHKEHLLFFQVGDFYEVFFDDAPIVAQALNIRLTSRDKDQDQPIPMCGVPVHAFDNYLPRLLSSGYSAVVVSQVEDAKKAKGMVRREITRIVTPGVRYEGDGLEESRFNFLAAAVLGPGEAGGIAYIDVSTGYLRLAPIESSAEMAEVLLRISPSELILPSTLFDKSVDKRQKWIADAKKCAEQINCAVVLRPFRKVSRRQLADRLEGLSPATRGSDEGSPDNPAVELGAEAIAALDTVLQYVEEVSFSGSLRLASFAVESRENSVFIDAATRRNLEVFEARIDGDRKNSLLHRLNLTKTAMGSRLLSEWLAAPCASTSAINERLDALEDFIGKPEMLSELRELLTEVRDIDRLITRVTGLRAVPRDLGTLKDSLAVLPAVAAVLNQMRAPLLAGIAGEFDTLADLCAKLGDALVDDPPVRSNEGGIFRPGFDERIDQLRAIRSDGRSWLAELEGRERERTGIGAGLKVKYNNVFGYFIEVTKTHLAKVPADYERRQTLVNGERFVTRELKEQEVEILSAKSRQIDLERDLFLELRQEVCDAAGRIQQTSLHLATLDVLAALAQAAVSYNYTRPVVNESTETVIVGGRHPVAELIMGRHNFIPNDVRLDCAERRFAVLTGPNMGGKSTYLRQIGLIQLLAQIGSFVPAERAELGLVDRIFTRIGAADDLGRGDSTFMVEMREAATIVRKATSRSLVLIDEVGRGTATSDGLAIAEAISEWLIDVVGCRTVFATHFHELTALPAAKQGAFCLSVGVIENEDEITFTHRIEEKAADRSYGIEVARLAGLPENLLRRAEDLLSPAALSTGQPLFAAKVDPATAPAAPAAADRGAIAVLRSIGDCLRRTNLNATTPIAALALLAELKQNLESIE